MLSRCSLVVIVPPSDHPSHKRCGTFRILCSVDELFLELDSRYLGTLGDAGVRCVHR
jgi:hypothetical protein